MLNVVATFELNGLGKLQVMPAALPAAAAPKVTTAQAAQLDSLSKEAARYQSMHAAIR